MLELVKVILSMPFEVYSEHLVTATTGKASYNISGCTIHSLLKLPVGSRGNTELTGQALLRLQNNLKGISYIIIDEYSMLGQTMLGWIDRCGRQATGISDEVFGGLSIILFGDPGQLPPVADKPLYHSKPTSSVGEQGHLAYLMFNNVIKLSVNQRGLVYVHKVHEMFRWNNMTIKKGVDK